MALNCIELLGILPELLNVSSCNINNRTNPNKRVGMSEITCNSTKDHNFITWTGVVTIGEPGFYQSLSVGYFKPFKPSSLREFGDIHDFRRYKNGA